MEITTVLKIGIAFFVFLAIAIVFMFAGLVNSISEIREQMKISNGYYKNIEKALLDLNDWIAEIAQKNG